ncbi:hypothetical protein ACSBR1_028146 [Camellia fascicularis]
MDFLKKLQTGASSNGNSWAEHLLHKGPSAFKEYIEECKQLGFDMIELNSGGPKAKPQFAVKFNKSDIPMKGDRAFGAYVVQVPRSSGIERRLGFCSNF